MCDLVIDKKLAATLGLLNSKLTVQEIERQLALPPLPDPPCPDCRPDNHCWFHRAWLPGAGR